MRAKLDENLPEGLELGDNVDTVRDEGLCGESDDVIWAAAQSEDRILFTQDLDFSDLRQFAPGQHAGVVILRLSNPSRQALSDRLRAIFATEDVDSWAGAFVVITESKIRIRRPD